MVGRIKARGGIEASLNGNKIIAAKLLTDGYPLIVMQSGIW